jgi:regulatory protein
VTGRVVTAVRDRGTRGVEVELDGTSWRTVPLDCAVEARLAIGVRVDRERARDLNRALRRRKALVAAARALRYADHSRASLDARLAERGFDDPIRAAALGHLQDAGLIDDGRVACARAAALAERGVGNAAIAADLERRGFTAEAAAAALKLLEPEPQRAARVVAARGRSVRTARLLASRGFDEDVVESAIAGGAVDGLG